MSEDADGARVGGFLITKFVSTPGKNEEAGKLQVTLEAKKDEINCGPFDLGEIIKAMNIHQESQTPIVFRVLIEPRPR